MKTKPGDLLVELGVPLRATQRLLTDPDAILVLGDLSLSVLNGDVMCFDRTVVVDDCFDVEEHLDYYKKMIAYFLGKGESCEFLAGDPQRVAVMSFEVESDEVMA